jgi:hypothetical protein
MIVNIAIASRINVVVVVLSTPSPPSEQRRMKRYNGGRGHCGDCDGIATSSLPWGGSEG